MRLPTADVLDSLLRPAAPPPKRPQPIERAAHNRFRVLQTVAMHGHLRCTDLATCWPAMACAERMAQRTVRALVKSGELKARANSLGGLSYLLTRRGVAALEVRGLPARHGLNLASVSGPTFTHFTLTSRWCLHMASQGYQAFNEYAIVNGYAPVSRAQLLHRFKKMPDAVLIRGDKLWLCETEASPKAMQKLASICALAEHVGRKVYPELPYVLAGVFIVFNAEQNHGARIAKAAHERWWRYSTSEEAALMSRITLSRVSLDLPLVWRGCVDAPLRLQDKHPAPV